MGAAPRFDLAGRRIWVAGHRGMVGRALLRRLSREPVELLTVPRETLDLTDGGAVRDWMRRHRPQVVILAAARVGGILANATRPVAFLEENLRIELEVIAASAELGVEKLLFLGSSCIYPRDCPQPIREEHLLTGPLEETNRSYALAKICGLELCRARRRQQGRDFIACMPTNLYGPFDNFDLETSHVLPALIRKAHLARLAAAGDLDAIAADEARFGRIPDDVLADLGLERDRDGLRSTGRDPAVRIWGSGGPRREFLHVDDLADACVHLLREWSDEIAPNVGTGEDIAILDLARMVCGILGFDGRVLRDPGRPDGTSRKLLDVSRITASGWRPRIPLEEGIRRTYRWFREHPAENSAYEAQAP